MAFAYCKPCGSAGVSVTLSVRLPDKSCWVTSTSSGQDDAQAVANFASFGQWLACAE